jgi:hypothetical protein
MEFSRGRHSYVGNNILLNVKYQKTIPKIWYLGLKISGLKSTKQYHFMRIMMYRYFWLFISRYRCVKFSVITMLPKQVPECEVKVWSVPCYFSSMYWPQSICSQFKTIKDKSKIEIEQFIARAPDFTQFALFGCLWYGYSR